MTRRGLRTAEVGIKLDREFQAQLQVYVLQPLNKVIEDKAQTHGWTALPEVTNLFARSGLCARRPLIRGVAASILLQGDTRGSFHPTADAHDQIADLIFSRLKFGKFLN